MRPIDADVLLQKLNDIECTDKHDDFIIKQFVGMIIRNEPTIEVKEVMHGEWISDLDANGKLRSMLKECSVCGYLSYRTKPTFCPKCGAKMNEKAV